MAPISLQNSFQNLDTNWGPRSETMSFGNPWTLKIWFIMTSAVSFAEGNLGNATNHAIFENRSTTVRTVVFPWETGSPVTKSNEMSAHGLEGMGSG